MLFKKIVAVFLLVFLAGRIAIAEDKNEEFTYVKVGQTAPFTGYLFTPAAIAKITTTCSEDLRRAELECTTDIANLNLDIKRITEIRDSEIYIKDNLLAELTKLKNEEIIAREKLLNNIEEERNRNKLFIAGSFLAGILLTGSVFYIISGIVK